jgi:hypothetical protein
LTKKKIGRRACCLGQKVWCRLWAWANGRTKAQNTYSTPPSLSSSSAPNAHLDPTPLLSGPVRARASPSLTCFPRKYSLLPRFSPVLLGFSDREGGLDLVSRLCRENVQERRMEASPVALFDSLKVRVAGFPSDCHCRCSGCGISSITLRGGAGILALRSYDISLSLDLV